MAWIVIKKLAQINYILYKLVIYKTFQDFLWDEYMSKFFILSNFFDNLCSNNDRNFKTYLSNPQITGALTIEGN